MKANPNCPKCHGAGHYHYDENHGKPCELCCEHEKGFFQLKEHYGHKNGFWCCLAGCGFTREREEVGGGKMSNRALIEEALQEAKDLDYEPDTCDLLRRLAAALEAQEWQPIETARDGTWILVMVGDRQTVAMRDATNRWNLAVGGIDLREDEEPPAPTHWLPLPEPPNAEKAPPA